MRIPATLILIGVTAATQPSGCVASTAPKPLKLTVGSIEVSTRASVRAEDDAPFALDLHDRGSELPSMPLPRRLTELRHIAAHGGRLAVLGQDPFGNVVATIDVAGRTPVAYVQCYQPSTSPSGRYVAYLRYYPRTAPPEVASGILMVWDYGADPARRGNGASPATGDGDPWAFVETAGAQIDAGRRVYPVEHGSRNGREEWVETADIHEIFPFVAWLDDETKLVVVDRFHESLRLVEVDLTAKSAASAVRARELDVTSTVRPPDGQGGDDWRRSVVRTWRLIGIEPGPKGRVVLRLPEGETAYRMNRWEVALPERK